ncbi:uncharacterized protein DUF3558 [Saccharothrix texasensis]|uniref:Uncharacterized protein DUF3558 n=1 Tax=Saccharothrix texasensis TaxID=103734 RepID=A0A3N1H709_9PSEU|nr:uncharacterized protein DUF3558 [Saccharothrix texasensis]
MLAVLSAAALTVLAGCSTEGTPTPATTTGTTAAGQTTEPSGNSGDVPEITGPELDLSTLSSPCELLKTDQLAGRGVSEPGTERTGPAGPTCQWRPDERVDGTSFSATFLEKTNGLDGFYENRDDNPVFEPTEVAGYPAVNSDPTDAKSGTCSTAVGTAKGKGFVVQVHVNDETLPEYTNPCSVTSAIAKTIVENLKG